MEEESPRPSSLQTKVFSLSRSKRKGGGEEEKRKERTDSPMSLDCRPLPSEFHSSSATRKGDTGPLASKLRNEAREFGRRLAPRNAQAYPGKFTASPAMQIEFEINWRDKLPPPTILRKQQQRRFGNLGKAPVSRGA